MEENIESPFTPSICNYCDESPNTKRNKIEVAQLKKVNLNNIFNEINLPSSIDKNQIQNVSSSFMKTPNKNSNSQSKNLNNYNSTSLSYQYSNSGQKSNSFRNQIIKNEIKQKENFIIQKNENINIEVNENFQFSKFENEEFSTFSFEIKPQKKTPNTQSPENYFKIESIPEESFIPHKIDNEDNNNTIKINNGFKLIPISKKSISSANQLEKTKSKTYEIANNNKNNIKKNNSTNRKQRPSIPIFKNNFINHMDIQKKYNSNNNNLINKSNINNISKTTNSNSKSKTRKIFPKQENKLNNKPNSNNDINNIIQRHFQQYYLTSNNHNRKNSKNKSFQNSKEKNKNILPITSLTTYINKISKNNNLSLKKEKKNKSLNNDRKSNTLKPENKLFYNCTIINPKCKNLREKVKSYINLSSILNNFPSNKNNNKKNNKSVNSLSGIFIKRKNNLSNYNSLNQKNINSPQYEKEQQIFLPETKNSPGEFSYNSNIKTFHTQDTVNTTKENNIINTNVTNTVNNTNNNIPIMKKPSPKVIKDFSFYKKKQISRTNFISLIDNKENNQDNNYYLTNNNPNFNKSKHLYSKKHEIKKPIASIKLKRLDGDIDSNISDEYYNNIYK